MTTSKNKQQFSNNVLLPLSTNKIQFRHAYSPQQRVQITFPAQGRTKQEFKDESDINQIMARYMRTGLIDNVTTKLPQFADVQGQDFYEAMQIVAESKTLFEELPSKIRTEFENDPGKFLDFVHNPENRPRMAEMGLLRPDADLGYLPSAQPQTMQPTPQSAAPQPSSSGEEPPKA